MCEKKPFDTDREAFEVALKMTQKKGEIFTAYKCQECDKHHVGHLVPKRRRQFWHKRNNNLIPGR